MFLEGLFEGIAFALGGGRSDEVEFGGEAGVDVVVVFDGVADVEDFGVGHGGGVFGGWEGIDCS